MGTYSFSRTGELIEITLRDYSGAKIESHTCNIKDKKKFSAILQYIKDKYGIEPEISAEDNINFKEESPDWWQ
jgi:hypothetical protein